MLSSKEKNKFRSTTQWKEFRSLLIKENLHTCQICASRRLKGLQIHHLDESNYTNLDPSKFICICPRCHRLLEQLLSRKDFNITSFCNSLKDSYNKTKANSNKL